MKREEKNQLSRQKILLSAMQEFGEWGYGLSSVNTICSSGGISKGILYHYFKDKDELYLACVEECFDKLTGMLRERVLPAVQSMEEGLQLYFDARFHFFSENPLYHKIFCEAVIAPPQQMRQEIGKRKESFDALNVAILTSLLQNAKLRGDIRVEEVVDIFRLYQDFANIRYQMGADGQIKPDHYERICERTIKVLLYGVIEREVTDDERAEKPERTEP